MNFLQLIFFNSTHISSNIIEKLNTYMDRVINAKGRISVPKGWLCEFFCYKINFKFDTPVYKQLGFETVYTLKSIYSNEVIFGLKNIITETDKIEYSCNFSIKGLPLPPGTKKIVFGYCEQEYETTNLKDYVRKIVHVYNSFDELCQSFIDVLTGELDDEIFNELICQFNIDIDPEFNDSIDPEYNDYDLPIPNIILFNNDNNWINECDLQKYKNTVRRLKLEDCNKYFNEKELKNIRNEECLNSLIYVFFNLVSAGNMNFEHLDTKYFCKEVKLP